jgi:peptidoglycan-N-acetylglucosamine deacetylase
MLTYRNVRIAAVVLLGAMLLVNWQFFHIPVWAFVLLVIGYVSIVAWGATNIEASFFMPVPCAADTQEKVVAITFDDGPLPQHTPQILDVLQQENVPAAFFCIGKNIAANEALLQRVDAEGHLIGNHSYSHHFWFDMFGPGKMLAELKTVDDVIEKAIGKRPRLFRPPYGVTNPNLTKAVKRGAYTPIGWNIRSLDTMAKRPEEVLEKVTPFLKPGAVILLHDSMEVTLQALPALIAFIRKEGYRIERIDKLLNIPAYA